MMTSSILSRGMMTSFYWDWVAAIGCEGTEDHGHRIAAAPVGTAAVEG